MYTKEEAAKLRKKFWTTFGQYMKPVPNAAGEMTNWINYKTGIRNLYFKMDADQQKATIAIELRHTVENNRLDCYYQFEALKKLLENTTANEWKWQSSTIDENGQTISSISQTLEQVNVLNEKDWAAIIGFLKVRIVSLDNFWQMVKDGFE